MPLRVVSSGTSAARAGSGAQVVVPDVVGRTEAAARVDLTDFTVRVRPVETAGTAGNVFAQDPPAPAVRPRRSVVTLFLIVNPAPDSDDVVTALKGLTDSVNNLAGAVETELSAKDRNDVVLKRLQKIEDKLPPDSGSSGGSGTTGKSTSSSSSKSAS